MLRHSSICKPGAACLNSCLPAGEQEAQLLVRGNALAGSLGLDQGPAAVAEKEAFVQLKAARRLLRSEARCGAPVFADGASLCRLTLSARMKSIVTLQCAVQSL